MLKKRQLPAAHQSLFVELVALAVGHYRDADADGHGREHQDQDAAAQGLNEALAGPRGLGVAQSAVLRLGQGRHEQRAEQGGGAFGVSRQDVGFLFHEHDLV